MTDLDTPKPQKFDIQKLKNILSGQAGLVLSGIVLSIVVFLGLHLYVNKAVNNLQDTRVETTVQSFKDDAHRIEKEFNALAQVVELANDEGRINSGFLKTVVSKELGAYEAVLWLNLAPMIESKQIKPFVLSDTVPTGLLKNHYLVKENITKIFQTYLSDKGQPQGGYVQDFIFNATPDYKGNWSVSEKPLVLSQQIVSSTNNEAGILLAFINIEDAFHGLDFKDISEISGVSISSGEGQPLYNLRENSAEVNALIQANFSVPLYNKALSGQISFQTPSHITFLKRVPFLGMFVIWILTAILVVMRSAILRKAKDMFSLNKNLADKNYELLMEMRKRERLNQKVRKSERENRAIINAVSDVIFEIDETGNIQFINETWFRITGFSVAETIGRKLVGYFSGDDRETEEESFNLLIQGKKAAYTTMISFVTKDNNVRPAELRISMLRQDEGKNLRVVGTLTDLQEKEQAERAVQEAQESYKRIWQNAANGIFEIALNGQILSANPAMAKILGYETPEYMMVDITNINKEIYNDLEEKKAYLNAALATGDAVRFEIKAKRSDGEEIWLSESLLAVFDKDNRATHFEGTMEDITERKTADITLKKAKLESDMANRAKTDFLANMSHELRTPLNSIIGFAELIKNQVSGKIDDTYVEYATEINESGNGLLRIITQILDVSKIEGGDRKLNESLVSVHKSANICIELMATKIAEKQLEIENNIPEDIENLVAEDRSVRQMFYNLFSNAVKFTPNKGSITLSASRDTDNNFCVSFTDTGVGLTEEELERAMTPFDIIEGDHSRDTYGMGLGLTLVQMLINLHGGRLKMQSEKEKGTTATLIFPAERVRDNSKKSQGEKKKMEEVKEDTSEDLVNHPEADVFETPKSIH